MDLATIAGLDLRWLAVAVFFQLGSFVCCWEVLRIVLRRPSLRAVAPSQLAGNAVCQVVPAGGAAGAALQLKLLTRSGVDAPTGIAGLTASGLLSTAGLLALPILVVPSIISGADVDSALEVGVWLSLGLLAALAITVAVTLRDRVFVALAQGVQRAVDVIGGGRGPHDLVARAIEQRAMLYETVRRRGGRVFAASFGQAVTGYLTLYAVVVSAGVHPSLVAVLGAFAAANLAGMVPVTPGGRGFMEAGLAGALSLGGVPSTSAVAIALAYRVVSSWLPAVAGGITFAWSTVRSRRRGGRVGALERVDLGERRGELGVVEPVVRAVA